MRAFRAASPEAFERVPGALVWRRAFPGRAPQVAAARRLVVALFAGTNREDDAAVIISELCTNAVNHTRSGEPGGWFGIEVLVDDLASIGVTDLGGRGRPVLQAEDHGEELVPGGLGIALVGGLAEAIGVHGSPELGHTVWADIEIAGGPGKSDLEGSFS